MHDLPLIKKFNTDIIFVRMISGKPSLGVSVSSSAENEAKIRKKGEKMRRKNTEDRRQKSGYQDISASGDQGIL